MTKLWIGLGNSKRAPWSVEDIDSAFVVKDSAGQKPAYVYYEEEPGKRSKTFPQINAISMFS